MPHRRPVRKGSFGAHFDELVKHFEQDRSSPPEQTGEETAKKPAAKSNSDVHRTLFEWAHRH